MKFYHGTTIQNWKKIKKEGVLWGIRKNAPSRCTYLTPSKREAIGWGDVVLGVEYDPSNGVNNYVDGCWQFRVYDPIPIKNIELSKIEEAK